MENNINFNQSASTGNLHNEKGKGQAIASMVIGIVTLSLSVLGMCSVKTGIIFFSFIFLTSSIVGLALASSAKKKGHVGGMLTAGRVLNIIALIISILLCLFVLALIAMIIFAIEISGVDIFAVFEGIFSAYANLLK